MLHLPLCIDTHTHTHNAFMIFKRVLLENHQSIDLTLLGKGWGGEYKHLWSMLQRNHGEGFVIIYSHTLHCGLCGTTIFSCNKPGGREYFSSMLYVVCCMFHLLFVVICVYRRKIFSNTANAFKCYNLNNPTMPNPIDILSNNGNINRLSFYACCNISLSLSLYSPENILKSTHLTTHSSPQLPFNLKLKNVNQMQLTQ